MRKLLSVGAEMNVWSLWMRGEVLGEISVRHTKVCGGGDAASGTQQQVVSDNAESFLLLRLVQKLSEEGGNANIRRVVSFA